MFSGASVYVSFSSLPQPQIPEAHPSPLSNPHLVVSSGVSAAPSNSSLQTCTHEPVEPVVLLVAVGGAVCAQARDAPSAVADAVATNRRSEAITRVNYRTVAASSSTPAMRNRAARPLT